MVLSLRAELVDPDPIKAALDKFTENFTTFMKTWTPQFIEALKETFPKSEPESAKIDDQADVVIDFEEEEKKLCAADSDLTGHEDGDTNRTELAGNSIVSEAGDHKAPPVKLEDQFTHNKVISYPYTDYSSLSSPAITAIVTLCANKEKCNIANKVFTKMPERDKYIPMLNPKPPDVYNTQSWADKIHDLTVPADDGDHEALLLKLEDQLDHGKDISVADDVFDKSPEPTEAKANSQNKKEFVYHEEIKREPSMKVNSIGPFSLNSSYHVSMFAPFLSSSLINDCGCQAFDEMPKWDKNPWKSKLRDCGLYWGERGKFETNEISSSQFLTLELSDYAYWVVIADYEFFYLGVEKVFTEKVYTAYMGDKRYNEPEFIMDLHHVFLSETLESKEAELIFYIGFNSRLRLTIVDKRNYKECLFGETTLKIFLTKPYCLCRHIHEGHLNISQRYTRQHVIHDFLSISDRILIEKLHIPHGGRVLNGGKNNSLSQDTIAIWVYSSGLFIYRHVAALIALIKHRDSGEFVPVDRIVVVSKTHGLKFSSYTEMCSKQFIETNLLNMVGYNLVALGCCSLPFILGCSKGVEIYFDAHESTATTALWCLRLIAIHAKWQTKCMLGSNLLLLVHSLCLPYEFLKNLIGDLKEWWEFKPKHMDKSLIFKMGKFNELLRMNKSIFGLCNFLEKMEILTAEIKYWTWYNILAALEQKARVSHVLVGLPKIVVVVPTMFCSHEMPSWYQFQTTASECAFTSFNDCHLWTGLLQGWELWYKIGDACYASYLANQLVSGTVFSTCIWSNRTHLHVYCSVQNHRGWLVATCVC